MAKVLIPKVCNNHLESNRLKSANVEIDQHIMRQTGGIDSVIKLCTSEPTFPSR